MSKFFIENDYDIQSGLCLIKAYSGIFLADINFLTDEASINDYKGWLSEYTKHAIVLDGGTVPQIIQHSAIEQAMNVGRIKQNAFKFVTDLFPDLEEEEVVVPFLGGIIGSDFRELLGQLWNTGGTDLYDYQFAIRSYYEGLFKTIAEGKE